MVEVGPEFAARGLLGSLFRLMKPTVIALLQVTALCAVFVHDLVDYHNGLGFSIVDTLWTCAVVFVGGFLTAGGANAINMWYDQDIDPFMGRTATRPVPSGEVSGRNALLFGVAIAVVGTAWFVQFANEVAAFWAAFSVLFYVLIYTMWLKRWTTQNIVIGGIAGSTPPVIGWAAAEEGLSLAQPLDLGAALPWLMFMLVFLWTPPHFWALALFRDKEYSEAKVPMLPSVKGGKHTLSEMRVYTALLIGISALFVDPVMWGMERGEQFSTPWAISTSFFLVSLTLGVVYNQSVLDIDLREPRDDKGRIPSAFSSFMISMQYLAVFFFAMVAIAANPLFVSIFISYMVYQIVRTWLR